MEKVNIELQDQAKESFAPFYDDWVTPIMMEKKLSDINGVNQSDHSIEFKWESNGK